MQVHVKILLWKSFVLWFSYCACYDLVLSGNNENSKDIDNICDLSLRQEMTLEEYEKVLEEKIKTLLALKSEERKVNLDKENDDEVFIKLGSNKDKRKEVVEKAKKEPNHEDPLNPDTTAVLRDKSKMFESI